MVDAEILKQVQQMAQEEQVHQQQWEGKVGGRKGPSVSMCHVSWAFPAIPLLPTPVETFKSLLLTSFP